MNEGVAGREETDQKTGRGGGKSRRRNLLGCWMCQKLRIAEARELKRGERARLQSCGMSRVCLETGGRGWVGGKPHGPSFRETQIYLPILHLIQKGNSHEYNRLYPLSNIRKYSNLRPASDPHPQVTRLVRVPQDVPCLPARIPHRRGPPRRCKAASGAHGVGGGWLRCAQQRCQARRPSRCDLFLCDAQHLH